MTLQVPIITPPWTGVGKRIESQIRKALYDHQMLDGVSKLAIALSGGKDSLTLLYQLAAISGRGFPELDLYAIHVSGAFSCGAGIQTDYLQGICEGLGVTYLERHSDQKLETLECYSCSRRRRTLLFDAAKSVGCDHIAFGHHRDDDIQTLLMNLLHKGEFAGTLPKLTMHKYEMTLLRPLILVSEADIRTFAAQHGFARAMCRCPVGQNSMRRQVDEALEYLEELFPNARSNLALASQQYGSDKASRA